MSGRVRTVALRDTSSADLDAEPGQAYLTSVLRRHDIEHFVCELTPAHSLIAVATTIAPGLEHFSLVRHNIPVVPTGRGSRIWAREFPQRV